MLDYRVIYPAMIARSSRSRRCATTGLTTGISRRASSLATMPTPPGRIATRWPKSTGWWSRTTGVANTPFSTDETPRVCARRSPAHHDTAERTAINA